MSGLPEFVIRQRCETLSCLFCLSECFDDFYVDRSTMPKERGYFWDGAARGSSKTAKNKSNSATLQAALGSIHRDQSGMGEMNNHLVLCDGEKDSEKDSGFSGNQVPSCMPAL